MADVFSAAIRSEVMSRIKSKGTTPELIVRKIAFGLGYRYRLNSSSLPGKPDLIFPRFHKVIFVHGCFWHQHSCGRGEKPRSNRRYWEQKLARNVFRDKRNLVELKRLGWKALVIWECRFKNRTLIENRIKRFLSGS